MQFVFVSSCNEVEDFFAETCDHAGDMHWQIQVHNSVHTAITYWKMQHNADSIRWTSRLGHDHESDQDAIHEMVTETTQMYGVLADNNAVYGPFEIYITMKGVQ